MTDSKKRLELFEVLCSLPLPDFLKLEIGLAIPSGIMPNYDTALGLRTAKLLEWVEGSSGCGMEKLEEVISYVRERPPENKRVKSLTVTLKFSLDELDAVKLGDILSDIQQKVGSDSIEVFNVQRGSVILHLSGSEDDLHKLKELFDKGELTSLADIAVDNIDFESEEYSDSRNDRLINSLEQSLAEVRVLNERKYASEISGSGHFLHGNSRVQLLQELKSNLVKTRQGTPDNQDILDSLHSGELWIVNSRRRNGLIINYGFISHFAGPGAAVGGEIDKDCIDAVALGSLSLIKPESSDDLQKAIKIRTQWLRLLTNFTDKPLSRDRVLLLLEQFRSYFDESVVEKIPDEAFALLIGVLPSTVRDVRNTGKT
ncbi:hypothetical protein VB780_12700 [Leptolyngbya sp. CCNP1308]|uniref:hypothetical protein n=1 Tax=Leptolyngbya sp. CCNP1308 TaxID=3110255 RepID=UPI002B21AA92|nr:hypothetical protein [Leptolyngbya sp. CCNP1308]MEA5449435.1 hypothetical protein [Leptolyngbya sp. CCNP1308]